MKTSDATPMPDFDRLAAVFDRFLPLIEPVGLEVLARLSQLEDGALVLDVACGTGEPGLTLARRSPMVDVVGIDAAPGMVDLARRKAAKANVPRIRFEVMTAEALSFAAGTVDAVISRFGLLMFGDRASSAKEVARILRPGGAVSLAVWDGLEGNTLVRAVVDALRPYVGGDLLSTFDQFPRADAVERLGAAGLADVEQSGFAWAYGFPDEETVWSFVSGPGMFERPFAEVSPAERGAVRKALVTAFAPYRQEEGDYQIPHQCMVVRGRKPR